MDRSQSHTPKGTPPLDGPSATDGLILSAERAAELAPRIAALLRDFRRLEEIVPAGIEPAMTPELIDEVSRERN